MEENMRQRAFTLVELLVVVTIIVILIALLLPALGRARDLGRSVSCASNMRQVGVALFSYAAEFSGFLPPCGSSYDLDPYGNNKTNSPYYKPPHIVLDSNGNPSPPPASEAQWYNYWQSSDALVSAGHNHVLSNGAQTGEHYPGGAMNQLVDFVLGNYNGLNLPNNWTTNSNMKMFVCPAIGPKHPSVLYGDPRQTNYQPNAYPWNSGSRFWNPSVSTQYWGPGDNGRASRISKVAGRGKSTQANTIMVAEGSSIYSVGPTWANWPLTVGDVNSDVHTYSVQLPGTDSNGQTWGTRMNWFKEFRHNQNMGMNLLFFDGHVGNTPDWHRDLTDLASIEQFDWCYP
jgi:prepilin-type N-terminal cleavage/methylation domain-containing protein/prepilin-type processing-associated H-X9-DG protein